MQRRKIGFLIIALLIVLYPLVVSDSYKVYIMNRSLIHAIIAIGLVTQVGFAGQISLGHAAFYGIGAYASALTVLKLGFPIGLGFLAAILLCVLCSVFLSVPSFKLSGFFLSLTTIAFGHIVWVIIVNWQSLTNGALGVFGIPSLSLFGTRFNNTHYYYLLVVTIGLLYFFIRRITNSFIGRAFMAMRDDELAAECSGINTRYFKLLAFGISAGFAGLAGAFYAHLSGFISPESFRFAESTKFVGMAVTGGLRHLLGGIVGAPIVTFLPEMFRFPGWETYYMMAATFVILMIVVFMPDGLAPLLEKGFNKIFGERSTGKGGSSE